MTVEGFVALAVGLLTGMAFIYWSSTL